MKLKLYQILLLISIFSLSLNSLTAQDVPGDDPAPGVTITPDLSLLQGFSAQPAMPSVRATSMIVYSDGISAAIEFDPQALMPSYALLVNKANVADARTVQVAGAKAETFGLAAGRVYDIKATGSDGRVYTLGQLSTYPYQPGDPVSVSTELYRALSQYVSVENQSVTLTNHLKQLAGVSMHEKISFLQRYAMNGAVLPAGIKGQYPDAYVRQALIARSSEGDCLCNFVMNTIGTAEPDMVKGNTQIDEKSVSEGPINYNPSSYWLRGAKEEGPAKNYLLASFGSLAGNKTRKKYWQSGEDGLSNNYARIGYNLLCVNFNELPQACDCQKTVKVDYNYSSRCEALSNTGGFGCVFEQEAAARAQDWVTVFATHEIVNSVNDVQILASGAAAATSTCSGGVPVSVLIDAAKIGLDVFKLIKNIKTVQIDDIIGQTGQIIDKVGELLVKLFEEKICSDALVEKPLANGTAVLTFKPNDPISIVIMASSSLEVVGRRCWMSTANVRSSFHLAGVLQGGYPGEGSQHCCTDYIANWLFASQTGDGVSQQGAVSSFLALNSPGGWQIVNDQPNSGGIINNVTEIGKAVGTSLPNGQHCGKQAPALFTPR